MTKGAVAAVCAIAILRGAVSTHAGGALESLDITGHLPSPIPGEYVARVIGIKWDDRAIPVKYSMNNTLNPIPNPLGPTFLALDAAMAELQASFDVWNNLQSSYIEMRITGTTPNHGLRGFDFVNELTFRTSASFTAIASSPSVTLIEDSTLESGDDIDGDGDSDVSSAIAATTDADGDGDLEFPAGFYKAGTILDNDVQFNTKVSNGFRFTIDPSAADTVTRSTDLAAIAVHEFGHSHGLSHSVNNQNGLADGDGAVMFPFIDTGDPVSELAQRILDTDDISYSSFFYREGTARSGPAALQRGDIAFNRLFDLIRGELWHGTLDQPVAGGHVFTVNRRNNTASTGAFSGTTQLSFNPGTGGLAVIDAAFNILDGKFVIPVLKGAYRIGIEPVDGLPVPANSVSLTAQIGSLFGQQNFNEEYVGGNNRKNSSESDSHVDGAWMSGGEGRRNLNIVTSRDINLDNFGNRNFIGFTASPAGSMYAVLVPALEVMNAVRPEEDILIKAVAFDTAVVDASVVPVFAEAALATGVVNADGTASIDLNKPLTRTVGFVAQDDDFAPLFFRNPRALGRKVRRGIDRGEIQNLFIVLRLPATIPFPGVSGIPPLIALDGGVIPNDVPIFGRSFFSDDGGTTFTRVTNFNFRFSLRLAEARATHDGEGAGDDGDEEE